VLIEQEPIENCHSLRAAEFKILRIDVTKLSSERRKEVLDEWFSYHLRCIDGNGHRWTSRHWLPELRAWIWEPCEKCGVLRLTQTTGNTIVWHQMAKYAEALIINKDFQRLENNLTKLGGHVL